VAISIVKEAEPLLDSISRYSGPAGALEACGALLSPFQMKQIRLRQRSIDLRNNLQLSAGFQSEGMPKS